MHQTMRVAMVQPLLDVRRVFFATLIQIRSTLPVSGDDRSMVRLVGLFRKLWFQGRAQLRGTMQSSKVIVSVTVAVAAIVGVSVASAADLPTRVYTKAPVMVDPAYNWSGFYVGGHVGGLWGRSRVFDDGVLTESGAATDGVVGGILAGYNWQTGPLVLGTEGDFGWSNAQGHGSIIVVAPPPAPPLVPRGPNTYNLRWDSHFVGNELVPVV